MTPSNNTTDQPLDPDNRPATRPLRIDLANAPSAPQGQADKYPADKYPAENYPADNCTRPDSGPGLPPRLPQNYKQIEALAEGDRLSVIVACPSCQTRFKLDPAKLQPVGRHVRCAKCGHRWLQLPEGMEPPGGAMPAAREEQPPTPATAPPPDEPAAEQAPAAEAATSAPAPEPTPAEAERASTRPPETPAEMAESLAAIAKQVAAAGETAAAAQPAAQKSDLRGPALRLGGHTGPITVPPLMRPVRPARRRSGLGLIVLAVALIGLLAAAYFFRDVIARTVPGAEAIYSLLDLATNNPAADLEISIDTHNHDDAKQLLSVTATVFNLSEHPVSIPPLMIVPVDERGNAMEPIMFRLQERVAEPGQNIKFQKSFDDWPGPARSFVLKVADAP